MESVIERIKPKFSFYEMGKMTSQQKIFSQVCQKQGLPAPSAEYRFHPLRKWRVDYFFHNPINGIKIALEVEGGVWGNGRHVRPSGFLKDMEKYNALAENGILLVRVIPQHLCTVKNLLTIKKALKIEE